MDKNQIVSKINRAAPGAVLEARRFGRSDMTSVWIEAQSIEKVAELLRFDPDISLDWLENLSVVELDGCLVLSYFLLSTAHPKLEIVVRSSLVPDTLQAEVEVPSVQAVWPMGIAMEQEAHLLFGVRFRASSLEHKPKQDFDFGRLFSTKFPDEIRGFPLRKKYGK